VSTLLAVDELSAHFGRVRALNAVSIRVEEGEIITLIGPNGAGKTTLLRSIVGVHRQLQGRISFAGARIDGLPSEQRVARGIALVPEGRGVLPEMSVFENLWRGAYQRKDRGRLDGSLKSTYALYPVLEERRNQPAGTLSGGQQQMLALGRALMAKPKLLMLDEPSLGLAPLMARDVFHFIRRLPESERLTILLVEQNARMALTIANRGYLLEAGNLALEGSSAELARNPKVREVYLGA